MSLLGQGLLWLLAGARRDQNVIYRLFRLLTRPVIRLVRAVMPRMVVDRHIPVVSFFLLLWIWLFLAYVRQAVCGPGSLACA